MFSFSGGEMSSKFGPGSGLSLSISSHKCTGLEVTFYDCLASTSSVDFSISDQHSRDIGVVCDSLTCKH